MYSNPSRRLRPKDVADLVKTSDFEEENRYAPPSGGGFVPWGKTSFKVISSNDIAKGDEPARAAEASHEPTDAVAESEQAQAAADEALVADADQVPAMPPALGPQDIAPTSENIIAEIEKAREDGRVTGYHQGMAAARQEFEAALDVLRRLEERLVPLADEAVAKNTEIIARHVRRIAQDLAGSMFATIPEIFVERIRRAAETFTRAGMEFSLAINNKDAQVLMPSLKGDDLFKTIRVTEDPELPSGGFRLSARDLEVEDVPELLGAGDQP